MAYATVSELLETLKDENIQNIVNDSVVTETAKFGLEHIFSQMPIPVKPFNILLYATEVTTVVVLAGLGALGPLSFGLWLAEYVGNDGLGLLALLYIPGFFIMLIFGILFASGIDGWRKQTEKKIHTHNNLLFERNIIKK